MTYHFLATFATTKRIIEQLLHDKRTIALMFLAPTLLMTLLWWVFSNNSKLFDAIAPALLGVFPFVIMFLITRITTLRERTGGTLERLMATRISKADIVFGYALAFSIFGIVQSLITTFVSVYVLGMSATGPLWFVVVVAIADTLLGVVLGLLASAFARTEFQAVQFMPAFIFPQLIVCGLFVPLAQLPDALNAVAYWLPLTYAVDALNGVVAHTDVTADMWRDVWAVVAFIAGALCLASLTLRRQSK